MSSVAVFVGLDYHQNGVQVCVMDGDGQTLLNRQVKNSVKAIMAAIKRVGRPVGVAVEACCGAADLAEKLHEKGGWSVSLAHPGFVARMKQNPDKTDYGDARLLADLLRVGYLPKVWLAPEEIRQLRRLMGQHLDELARLNRRVQEAEARLEERAAGDAVIGKLMSFRGIGLITAVIMRAEIGRFDRFGSGKQLARFCGLSPRNASSGDRQADAGLIRAGNPKLRNVLMQLGQRVAYRPDGRWAGLVHRLLNRGKPKNVVVAAVANRYMRWLYHQMQPEQLAA